MPIRKCPLDHFLEPASLHPGNTIREFSFLGNPRAAALKASTASTALVAGAGAAAELKRLVASYAETKVLHITNKLGPGGLALDADWLDAETLTLTLALTLTQTQTRTLTVRLRLTRLDDETQRKFTNKFQGASGSWCCAPGDEASKGAARSSYFRLLQRPARPKLNLLRRAARMVTKRKAPT